MGEKGIAETVQGVLDKLPPGYHLAKSTDPLHPGFYADPDGRPGPPLAWDEAHGTWTPPGFVPDGTDSDRIFNKLTGKNGVWDKESGRWLDSSTGSPLSYEQ